MASVLQFNTSEKSRLVDIDAHLHPSKIINEIVNLFNDNENNNNNQNSGNNKIVIQKSVKPVEFECSEKILMNAPHSIPSSRIFLSPGRNTIWININNNINDNNSNEGNTIDLSKDEGDQIDLLLKNFNWKINGESVGMEIKYEGEIRDDHFFADLIKDKVTWLIDKIKILQILGTKDSLEEIDQIVNHFKSVEKYFIEFAEKNNNNNNDNDIGVNQSFRLKARIEKYKKLLEKRKKSLFNMIMEVANNNKVSQLNSAQQAEYLRNADVNKNTKALARRANQSESGFNFTETVHSEVKEMKKHLYELNDVDDLDHNVSFYSQDTTLGGIKAVCSLIDEGMLEDLEASEILEMINIVGVACDGEIGDYPDPMTWRVKTIYLGCYLSVSDLAQSFIQSHGKQLTAPGFGDQKISTVIPIFDDIRILNFLKKYAPKVLEFTASIGMRRMIADVNTTHSYVLVAAVWKLIQMFDNQKTSLLLETLKKTTEALAVSFGTYFDHVLPFLRNPPVEKFTFSIANNGITNMILPIYKLYQQIDQEGINNMSRMLRSAYSFEGAQIVRRVLKKKAPERKEEYAKQLLEKLLNLDLSKQILSPLFEPDVAPTASTVTYSINDKMLDKYIGLFKDIDYCVLFPSILSNVQKENYNQTLNDIPTIDDKMIQDVFNIQYDIRKFKFYTLIQSLLYFNSKDRYDPITKQMKITDLTFDRTFEKNIRKFVFDFYTVDFQSKLIKKTREEQQVCHTDLANQMACSSTIDDFLMLFKEGLTRNTKNYLILNSSSFGSHILHSKLIDISNHIPFRLEKLKIFLLAQDVDGNSVWNNGNSYKCSLEQLQLVFEKLGADWEEFLTEYKLRSRHTYRGGADVCNRHGHSNDKPSYWALGYATMDEMISKVSTEEFEEYKKIHCNCCGVNK